MTAPATPRKHTMRYPIVIHKDPDSCYGVIVPDLPGCFSAGDTMDEAIEQAREAILFHLEGLIEDGQEPPAPQLADDHRANPDYADAAFWALVEVPEQELPGKAIRLNITMNERVLSRLDAAAEAQGDSRSGLLQRLASDYVAGRADAAASASPSKRTKASSRPKRPAKRRSKPTGRKADRSA